ncbi:MAG: peptidoglycan DD-metalloendopeptidase family protein [Bacteroidetes bacterium]|nr:peptidoglycan DD-metalloendopeptidase family protein [Bacteroidota bacterium]
MRYTLCILLCLFSFVVFAQEKESNKKAVDKFVAYYNASLYDSVFVMFSPEMQNALPLDRTKEFLGNVKETYGSITDKKFTKYAQGFASYKTIFTNTVLALNMAVDESGIIKGMSIKPFQEESDAPVKQMRVKTKLILPFNEIWYVGWGGDTKELNYHVESRAQKNAFDWLMIDKDSSTHYGDGKKNEDYYAFGKPIFAPCDGEIVLAIDGVKDNVPGEMNSFNVGGNMVILKTINNEYLVFCHFKHQSVKVKEGQTVKQGQTLGLCGNSGHSSEPHLHFHIQDVEDMNKATGIKAYFDNIIVNGQLKTDYSPIKDEMIKNAK